MKSIVVILVFVTTALAATAGSGFYLGPMAGIRINGVSGKGIDDANTVLGFSAGFNVLNVLGDLGGNFRVDGGILFISSYTVAPLHLVEVRSLTRQLP